MTPPETTRLLPVVVQCASCGVGQPLHVRTTARVVSPVELRVECEVDGDDRAWLRLFTDAHRGPFRGAR